MALSRRVYKYSAAVYTQIHLPLDGAISTTDYKQIY